MAMCECTIFGLTRNLPIFTPKSRQEGALAHTLRTEGRETPGGGFREVGGNKVVHMKVIAMILGQG